jgi:surface carbohydrate biosynthesis protein
MNQMDFNLVKKIFSYLLLLLKAKKVLRFPIKNQIVILDNVGSEKIIDLILGERPSTIIDMRLKTVNVPILFLCLFSLNKYGKYAYYVVLIKYVEAKLAITFIDTSYYFCKILKYIPDCKLAFIQNGRPGNYRYKKVEYKSLSCEYYFTNSMSWSDYASKYLNANYVEIGSIINNNFRKANHEKIRQMLWISQWRPYKEFTVINDVNIKYEDLYKSETTILPLVSDFCKKHNLQLKILSVLGVDEEKLFYESIINEFEFHKTNKNTTPYMNYERMSDDSMIVGVDSQLQYEALARNFRTGFFSVRGHYMKNNSYTFAWPKKVDSSGTIWCNYPNKTEVYNIMEYLLNVKEDEWLDEVNKYKDIMAYDSENKIIINTLKLEQYK